MKATLIARQNLHNDIKALIFKPAQNFTYQAGQYVEIAFGGFSPRAYSIAGAPNDRNELEIHIKDFGPGGASHFATNELKIGASVEMSGPYGNCTRARADQDRPVLIIAGGLGITPLRAIIDDILHNDSHDDSRAPPVTLYWGTRTEEELYLRDYFEDLAQNHKNFTFVPVIDDPVGPVAAAHYRGLEKACIFLAGPPAMISSTIKLLRDGGADAGHIHYDTHPEAAARPAAGAPS